MADSNTGILLHCTGGAMDRLDERRLRAGGIIYRAAVGSTNTAVREMAERGAPEAFLVAEEQRRGRGRRGRSWNSLPGRGLWFSLLLRPAALSPAACAPVTLAAAAALAGRLRRETALPVGVKWPNDLLLRGRKLGGILTEVKGNPERVEYLIMGVGLNVNHAPADFPPELRGRATSLHQESGLFYDRTALLLILKEELEQSLERFSLTGFAAFRRAWLEVNATLGRRVSVARPGGLLEGEALDVDAAGALLVRDTAGRRHRVCCGEII